MKTYRITVREVVYTDYAIAVPDDCTDVTQFFHDMPHEDQEAARYDSDSFNWEVVIVEPRP